MIDIKMAPYAAFLLRVASGILLLAHGLLKVLVFTIPGTVSFFESVGFPGFFAYVTIFVEIGGGLTLIIGAYTRVVALALVPIMLGATFVHSGNGWLFMNAGGGWEFPAFWTVALVTISLLGSGAFAVGSPAVLGRGNPT